MVSTAGVKSPLASALRSAIMSFICASSAARCSSCAFLAVATSHLPARICSRGPSISIGWPIHATFDSLSTMKAQGMPRWPAARIHGMVILLGSPAYTTR